MNFAVDVLLAIGLGFDAAGARADAARAARRERAIVDRTLAIRLGIASVVMAGLALASSPGARTSTTWPSRPRWA